MKRKSKTTERKILNFAVPFLPPSLNSYRRCHWAVVEREEKRWKDQAIRVTLNFCFPDRRNRDLDKYLATGSKLVGKCLQMAFHP